MKDRFGAAGSFLGQPPPAGAACARTAISHRAVANEIDVDVLVAVGNGSACTGSSRWRRLTEERSGSAKSVFHFDVQGSVAKSTHAGIPWLRFIRQRLGERAHFWPVDGWDIPVGRSAIAEVYPRLWSRDFAPENRTGDQHDANRCLAPARRSQRQPRGLPEAHLDSVRMHRGASRGLDIGGAWLNPRARSGSRQDTEPDTTLKCTSSRIGGLGLPR